MKPNPSLSQSVFKGMMQDLLAECLDIAINIMQREMQIKHLDYDRHQFLAIDTNLKMSMLLSKKKKKT